MKVFQGIPKWRPIIEVCFSALWSIFSCNYVLILAGLTEKVVNDIENLPILILHYALFFFIWAVLEFIADCYNDMSLTSIENGVSSLYFKKIYNIKPTVLKKYNTGYISGLLTKMIARQVNAYTQTVQQFPLSLFYILFFSYKIWDFHWSLGLVFVFLILLAVTFQIIGSRFVKKRASELTEAEGLRNKLVADTVINIGTVQKMQGFDFIDSKMVERVEDCRRRTIKYSMTKEFFFCFFKMSIFMFVPICLLIYFNFLQGTSFDAVGFFSLISVVGLQLVHIAKHFSVTFEKNMEFLGAKKKLDEVVADMNKRNQLDENDFVSAKIENLDFTYQIEKENIDKLVHINIPLFELNRGDITCIYGESGQGKATLLHILSGEIETDNVYINGEKTDKRLECVFIAQDTEILDMSLRDNLVLGSENISDELLIDYIEQVGLKDWFDRQKYGLDTLLGERGVFVSTGQRQRLNLIRGLLRKDKEIYLLDEPTSNVDVETEEKMVELIKSVLKDKTVVIVTHRPKIIEICNNCYKFENSKLEKVN